MCEVTPSNIQSSNVLQQTSTQRWQNLISNKLNMAEKSIHQMIDLIKYPVITEKTYAALIQKRQFTFHTDPRLTKSQIKNLFESLFKVDVISVNTLMPPRKKRRVGVAQGFRPVYKKVIVKLKPEQSLNFLLM